MPTSPPSRVPLPEWIPRGALAPARQREAELVAEALTAGGHPWVVGPPDAGVTAVAATGALVTGLPVVAVRLTGARTSSDVRLAIGGALSAAPPGDQAVVADALRDLGAAVVLLDDADLPDLGDTLDALSALAPRLRWLCTGRAAPAGHTAGAVLRVGSRDPGARPPLSAPERLEPRAALAAWTGLSLHGAVGSLPQALLVPVPPGRTALRRTVCEAVQAGEDDRSVARAALAGLAPLLALAEDAPLPWPPHPDDAALLRWLSARLDGADEARTAAAAARIFDALGAHDQALACLSGEGDAWRWWARGDMALARGEEAEAVGAWRQARRLLDEAGGDALLARHLRRRADRLADRGEDRRAARLYREARDLARRGGDEAGALAAVQGAAGLAATRGEVLAAELLLEEGGAGDLVRASLAVAQGDLPRARAMRDAAVATVPLQEAARDRLGAEIALREGRHDAAWQQAGRAADALLRLGEVAAAARALRLQGDTAASAGRAADAVASWQRAAALQVRVRDHHGLARTLEHALLLEEEAVAAGVGDSALVRRLQRALAELRGEQTAEVSATGGANEETTARRG